MQSPRAFTLVELLVVMTVIVVLLSLLAPALDTAIYEAELATCAAQLRAVAMGTLTYAFDHQRRYPHRPGVADPDANWQPNVLYSRNEPHNALAGRAATLHDERTVLSTYLDINATLNDPLVTAVDYWDVEPVSTVWASRILWFGWRYTGPEAGKGMMKVGDRFTARDFVSDPPGQEGHYAVLVSDFGKVYQDGTRLQSSHPDHDGMAAEIVLQNDRWVEGGDESEAFRFVFSLWGVFGNVWGPVDLNYAFDDASVQRYGDVAAPFDARMGAVSEQQSGGPGWLLFLPR